MMKPETSFSKILKAAADSGYNFLKKVTERLGYDRTIL